MNNQEIFDNAARGLMKQRVQSKIQDGKQCLYRGPGGRKCGIGFSIPDVVYVPEMDTTSLGYSLSDILQLIDFQGDEDLVFDIRDAHDNDLAGGFDLWHAKMLEIAKLWNLSTTTLEAQS